MCGQGWMLGGVGCVGGARGLGGHWGDQVEWEGTIGQGGTRGHMGCVAGVGGLRGASRHEWALGGTGDVWTEVGAAGCWGHWMGSGGVGTMGQGGLCGAHGVLSMAGGHGASRRGICGVCGQRWGV